MISLNLRYLPTPNLAAETVVGTGIELLLLTIFSPPITASISEGRGQVGLDEVDR
jgi:hypothetical protein